MPPEAPNVVRKEPILTDLPEQIETGRLLLRPVREGDGATINVAVLESIEALQLWMPWATPTPTVEVTETWCRKTQAEALLRKGWHLLIFSKQTGGYLGTIGMHNIDWDVPRFEIGYWLRQSAQGHGYMAEAVEGLTRCMFERFSAQRVEIRMDQKNDRSRKVAERAGFELEGLLRCDSRSPTGEVRSTFVYSKVRVET